MSSEEKELLIEMLADIYSLTIVGGFLGQSILERLGADPEPIMDAVEKLNTRMADLIEAGMRKRLGMEDRNAPRQSMREHIDAVEEMRAVDWSKMSSH